MIRHGWASMPGFGTIPGQFGDKPIGGLRIGFAQNGRVAPPWPRTAKDQDCSFARSVPLEISLSQGAEWNALISAYIGIMPVSGDA